MHIGVLSPVTGGFYFGDVLAGVVREVASAGGRVTLVQTLDAGNSGDELVPAPDLVVPIGWDHLDGFVSIAQAATESYLRRLRASGKPLVLVGNDVDVDAAAVVADNHEGVRAAVSHLVAHGHSRIAFVGNLAQMDMRERYEAYRAGMHEHGLDVGADLFVPTRDHVELGGQAAAESVAALASAPDPVTALIASTDRIALGMIPVLESVHGVRVPHDLAVVGFDAVEAGWRSTPPLATVDQQIQELGVRAARLLLAEVAGGAVEHRRHTVPSTFLPRRSCGCTTATAPADGGRHEADTLVGAIVDRLRLADGVIPDGGTVRGAADLGFLDDLVEAHLRARTGDDCAPTGTERFTEAVVQGLGRRSSELAAAGRPGAEVLNRCLGRVAVILSHRVAVSGLSRSDQLAESMNQQYEVGMGLLGRVGTDPTDLTWLSSVPVQLGCLGLWDGPPGEGTLRIAGVHDPHGWVTEDTTRTCQVESFPPRAFLERSDPARQEVTFVIPVRGGSGDHGLLCMQGTVDTRPGTGRATYNHWAALLGVALKQQALLEHVRRSEERYSLAASATRDGLWDWDVTGGTCFWSDRCLEMLGLPATAAGIPRPLPHAAGTAAPLGAELAPWTDLVHPEDAARLLAEIRAAVRTHQPVEVEHRIRTQGSDRWMLCRALPVGEPGQDARRVVGSLSDIHPRRQLQDQLRRAAFHDAVTGLPNRRLFLDRLRAAVLESRLDEGSPFAVVFLDLDGFKLVNDSLGHQAGDRLLRTVADRLQRELREVDLAARFGGDEFAVLLTGLRAEAVRTVVDRIRGRIAQPVRLDAGRVVVSASVGIAFSGLRYADAEDVLRDADIAMYHAKRSERGTASVFEPAMHQLTPGRLPAGAASTALLDTPAPVAPGP